MASQTTPHRRSSTSARVHGGQSTPTRLSNPNIFSDDYALEPLQVADGFQPPTGNTDNIGHISREWQPSADFQVPFQQRSNLAATTLRRNTGSQKGGGIERGPSISSQYGGPRTAPFHSARTSMLSEGAIGSYPHRSISNVSNFSMPRTQSPYQGATGPSHPYGMYPQDISVLRTPSTATTSTIRPRERPYSGPSGPTQPYGMYSQNTVPEDEISPVSAIQQPMPVGFPGRTPDYRRRLGANGEDADDLIGPDGYTEQLPPYTRYPNNVPPKNGAPGPASILSAEREQLDASEETLMNPFNSRESVHQNLHTYHSSTQLTAEARSEAHQEDTGGNFKERVKEKGKKKVLCGLVPLWLVAILVIAVVAVLAGVIGGVVGRARGQQQNETSESVLPPPSAATQPSVATVTTTSLVDATPLPSTPTNLPPLPTGAFTVPLRNPSISNNFCLNGSSYPNSWSCVTGGSLQLDISDSNMVTLSPSSPVSINRTHFGAQPPQLDQPAPLSLMNDKDWMAMGPAWFFQQAYTKVVVVPDTIFQVNPGTPKRWFGRRNSLESSTWMAPRSFERHTVAQPSAKPWFCYWNGTILEGFIYVNQTLNDGDDNDPSAYATTSSDPADFPSAPFTIATSFPFSPSPSGYPIKSRNKRQASESAPPAVCPKIVKIEERRNPNTSPQPYCVQYQIMNDYTAQLIPNVQPVFLDDDEPLSENEVQNASGGHHKGKRADLWERDVPRSACECEWTSS